MLPPGTLTALKGHADGIVTVVLFATTVAALAADVQPKAVLAALGIAFLMFHIRCESAQRHQERLAVAKVEAEAAKVEGIKARHRDRLEQDQPTLPLNVNRRRPTEARK